MKKSTSVLVASLIAAAALVACGKKEDAAPAVVTPAPAPVTEPAPPAAAPATAPTTDSGAMAPAPGASSALDAANAATEAAKKNEAPKQ